MSDRARSRSPPRERSPPRDGGGDDRDRDSAPAAAAPEGSRSGTCARWHAERGFGFITPDDGGEDVFCHVSSITDGNALPEGQKVTYDKEFDEQRGKERAQNVAGGMEEDRSQRMGGGGGCECSVLCALCSPVMLCVEKLVC